MYRIGKRQHDRSRCDLASQAVCLHGSAFVRWMHTRSSLPDRRSMRKTRTLLASRAWLLVVELMLACVGSSPLSTAPSGADKLLWKSSSTPNAQVSAASSHVHRPADDILKRPSGEKAVGNPFVSGTDATSVGQEHAKNQQHRPGKSWCHETGCVKRAAYTERWGSRRFCVQVCERAWKCSTWFR